MKNKIVIWLGLVFALSFLLAACSETTPSPQAEEPKPAESVVTQEPTAEIVVTEEPEPTGPRTGDMAPDLTLPDGNGNMVSLADELHDNRMVILVFYHGHF